MAPTTAWLFVLFSTALFARVFRSEHPATRLVTVLAASLPCLIGLFVIWNSDMGVGAIETNGVYPVINGTVNPGEGRMSFLTAVAFIVCSVALGLPLVAGTRYPWMRQVASRLGAAVSLLGLTVLLGYMVGAPLFYGTSIIPMALPTAIEFILLGWVLAVTPNPLDWMFRGIVGERTLQDDASTRTIRLTRITLVLVVFAVIAIVGVMFMKREIMSAKTTAGNELQTIAQVKSDQISAWYRERLVDADLCSTMAPLFLGFVPPGEKQDHLQVWMDILQRHGFYGRVVLMDSNLNVISSSPVGETQLGSLTLTRSAEALQSGKSIVSDLHLSSVKADFPHMDIIIPLSLPGRPPRGVMLMEISAALSLYPVVDIWPIFSQTAETLLIRAEGKEVLFLNRLRHRPDAALKFKLPLDTPGLPAAVALRGKPGIIEGLDYRRVPVLAAFQPVPGTPWTMVVKIDQAEVYGAAQRQTWLLTLILMILSMTVYLGLGLIWQRHSTHLLRARLAAEESQRRSEFLVTSIIENTAAVVFVKDLAGRYMMVNRRYADLFHVTQEGVIGKTDYDIFPAEYARRFQEADQRAIASDSHIETEERVPHDDGIHTYLDVKFPIPGSDGKPCAVCGISTDITEIKRLQEDLDQAHKMETVGQLAGGIAHDFNNLLQILFGHTEMLLEQLTPGKPQHESVSEIQRIGKRAAALTRQLLAFGRRQVLTPTVMDLNELVSNVSSMLVRLIGENIRLTFEPVPGLWRVKADVSQIEQVLINLVVNSRDAMPSGGTIFIRAENIERAEGDPALQSDRHAGRVVRLSVADTGIGMAPDIRARIFEPFFTTKERGKGTGMGLASVYGIIKQHGGVITVDSEPGKGTVFTIDLPAADGEAVTFAPAFVVPASGGRNERILVVEDEISVCRLITQTLVRNGYRVTAVETCAEAEALNAGNFDLVLSDVVLSDGNGVDLVRSLRRKHPLLRCVLTSGYADIHARRPEITQQPFLVKPFSSADLLNTLAAALGHSS